MKRLQGSSESHVEVICFRDLPAHSSGRGVSVTGMLDRNITVKDSSWAESSSNREAMRVYCVANLTFREIVRAWCGTYSPD
jgi:hypothetical protein